VVLEQTIDTWLEADLWVRDFFSVCENLPISGQDTNFQTFED